MPLYERLIREGAWWDLVDETAAHLVGQVLSNQPDAAWPTLDSWIHDDDMWVRRAAMIAQIRRGEDTDSDRLFRYAKALADEDEFFIRKAIGWALREYAKSHPDDVTRFLADHRERFSNLTLREASKHLDSFEV